MDGYTVIETLKDAVWIGLLFAGLILIALALVSMLSATSETSTLTKDEMAVDTTSDGETVAVLYEVNYTQQSRLDSNAYQNAVNDIREASICANSRLDSAIGSNTWDSWQDVNQSVVVEPCETQHISITTRNETLNTVVPE